MTKPADSKLDTGAVEPALVVDLTEEAALDRERAGGKASSLAELVRARLPVPPGFCITTAAQRLVMRENGIEPPDSDAAAAKVCERLRSVGLPEGLEESIRAAFDRLRGDERFPVAVRSSAVGEDRRDASFAGQYETSLGITEWASLLDAIRSCWASLYSEPALAYRRSRAERQTDPSIAVVVQRLIDAEVSGVAFSCDPVTGDDAVLVDASWGLGEAVASGWVTPDHYRLSRSGDTLDRRIADKRVRAVAGAPGERVSVADEIAHEPCLTDEELRDVAGLALRAELEAGTPQDIEFALSGGKLWLLQSRPITTIAPMANAREDADDEAVPEPLLEPGMHPLASDRWTRAIADEYWADPVTPFSFSSLGSCIDRDTTKAMDRIMGFNEIDPDRPTLRLFRSHAYWNADTVAAGFKYVPASARTDALLAYLPPAMREEVASTPTAWRKRLRGELLMRLRDRDSSVRRNHRALDAHARRVEEACTRLDRTDLGRAGLAEVDRCRQQVDPLGREHFKIIRWGVQQHSVTFNFLLAKLLEGWVDDDGHLFRALIGGAGQNLTLKTNRQIWLLARLAEREPAVQRSLENAEAPPLEVGGNPPSPLYEELTGSAGDGAFARELRAFLDSYGHRGFSRDIGLPRWSDQPDAVLFLVAQALGDVQDPDSRADVERAEREAAGQEVRRRLGTGAGGRTRRLIIDLLLPLARTYTAFRENQRFTLDRILLRARRVALAYGRLLAERDAVDDAGEVFFLTLDEALRALDGDIADVSRLVDTRRQAFEADSHSLPPMYLRGDEAIAESLGDEAEEAGLSGMPVSTGRIMARCHVVSELEDAVGLEQGEILVASNIDPGWTPLLVKLGGLVLETGGVLAHGAIVAREYGIPAVTAVSEATRRIKDGEWITVDGRAGTVECHGEKPPTGASPSASGQSDEGGRAP